MTSSLGVWLFPPCLGTSQDHRISLVGQIYLAVGLYEASLQAPLECVIAGFLPLGEVG